MCIDFYIRMILLCDSLALSIHLLKDTMCGTICMSVYAHVFFFSGLSLATLATDMRQFAYQLKLCQQNLALAFVIPCEQLALNLSGQTEDPIDVSPESMKRDLESYHDELFNETSTSEDVPLSMALYFKAFSAYLFNDLDVAKETIDKLLARKTKRLDGTQIMNIFFAFVDGIVSFALIRSNKRKAGKYRALAKASMKELGRYAKKRSLNVAGLLSLLLAEKASLSEKNPEVLRKKYGEVSAVVFDYGPAILIDIFCLISDISFCLFVRSF